jgi:16S rRNA (cytidine1402-2'-O)-methyltransferase
MLYIIPTPIGNLKDITLRALETLKEVDGIICEDSRRTSLLLSHFQIQKPLLVLNDFNEFKTAPQILEKLKQGEKLALVSDAGTPLISDPGFKLVRSCLEENIRVDSLPGAASPIVALTLSGLPPDKFMFLGYPPDKPGHRQALYNQMQEISNLAKLTYILFIAPFKILKTLEEMKEVLGDINITLAKELTKIHQKVETKSISSWLEEFKSKSPKGEWIMLLRLR